MTPLLQWDALFEIQDPFEEDPTYKGTTDLVVSIWESGRHQ